MKKVFFTIIFLGLICCIGYIYLQKIGFSDDSILNLPETIDLTVTCSEVNDLILTTEVNVTVKNNSSRFHHDVTVRVTGFDVNGNITKEKTSTFKRVLGPNSSFSKPITLPPRTKSCKCVIESSNPQ